MRTGVDLGGTKIEAVVLDAHGRELARERVATPVGDYPATIAAVRDLVVAIERPFGTRLPVGVGMPGSISPSTGLVRNANSVWLNGRRFPDDLEAALDRPVRVANDADCFALSEAGDGAAAGRRVVFGVILGTGVGGGLVFDGRPWRGHNGIAGEWGHNPLGRLDDDDPPPPSCWCGRHGCVETYLSGPALLADHRRRGGDEATTRAIVDASRQGAATARATVERYARRLAKALAVVINVVDPDVVVLGGGLSNIDELYALVPPRLPAFVFADAITTTIVRNRHGDSSGVRGAARLWASG